MGLYRKVIQIDGKNKHIKFVFSVANSLYELNIVHYNDFHARFEETNVWGGLCEPETAPCIGGFARLVTAIKESLAREPESLVLNAGDSFQGTIWYNLLRWNVTQEFMNMIHHDAHVLGNHEFDNGVAGAVPYIEYLDAVTVTANIIDDDEPTMHGIYKPSEVFMKNGRRVGVIGVIISTTNEMASTGALVFTDEVEAVKREAEILHNQGVDIIIVLSHCGIEIDRDIARNGGPYIDLIVGGHSHTLLYTGDAPGAITPQGPYPTLVEQDDGRTVPIVQASAYTEYLGEIKLYFDDDNGTLLSWNGVPRYLSNDIAMDPEVEAKLAIYRPLVDEQAKQQVGYSYVSLSSSCSCSECNLGNLICDGFLHSVIDRAEPGHWHYAHMSFTNQGGIRTGITSGKLLLSTPFENNVEVFDLRGDHIWEAMEFSLSHSSYVGAHMLQYGGARVVFNGTAQLGSRVMEVKIRCIECDVPRYEPIQMEKYYKIVSQSFIGDGGDGFSMIANNRRNVEVVGVDYDLLQDYLEYLGPITQEEDERITIYNACQ